MNLVDLVAIMPYYLTEIMTVIGVDVSSIKILRLLRLVRVLRVLKLAKYNRSVAVAIQALLQSTDMFGLMIFMLIILCILFAALEFSFEEQHEGGAVGFNSIPAAMWWCIVTVMMVGYGDMYPVTVMGKLIAAVCIVIGILIMALPISVIGTNFSRTWDKYEQSMLDERKLKARNTVLTLEQEEMKQLEALEKFAKHNEDVIKQLQEFCNDCDQQVEIIKQQEDKVFSYSQKLWESYAVDINHCDESFTLWREREVRAVIGQGMEEVAGLNDENDILNKALDQELDDQLRRALYNIRWSHLFMRKFALVSQDAQKMLAHFGVPYAPINAEVAEVVLQGGEPSRDAAVPNRLLLTRSQSPPDNVYDTPTANGSSTNHNGPSLDDDEVQPGRISNPSSVHGSGNGAAHDDGYSEEPRKPKTQFL